MSLMQATITTVAHYPGLLCAFDFSQTDAQTLEAVSANGAISGIVTFPQGVTIGGDGVSLDGTQSAQFAGDSGDTPLTVLFIVTPTTADTFELYHNSYASRDTILSVEAGNPRFYYKSAYNNSENTINHTAAISLDKVNLIGFHTKNREANDQYSLEFGLAGETGNRESAVFVRGPYHSYSSATLFRSAFAGIANGMLVFDRQLTEAQIDEILYSLNIYGQISLPTNLNPDRFQSGAVLTAGRTIEGNFELAAGESTLSHFSTSQKGTPLEFVAFDTDEGGSVYKTAPLDPSTATELDFQAILGGAGGSSNQTSKVSGVVQIDGNPAERTVRAFGYDPTAHQIDGETLNLSKSLGHATSDPETGAYTIDLLAGYDKRIFVVAFDDYGADFTPDKALSVGDRVHPTTPNGHVWECTGAGALPSEEPTWIVDTETAQLYGTASMIAKPFYRPMVHGPVSPEVTLGTVNGDEYFNSVTLLTRFDGADGATEATDLSNTPATITFGAGAVIKTDQSKFGGASLYLDGSSNSYVRTNRVQNIGTGEFTLEAWIRPAASNTMRIISSQDLVNTQAVLTLRVNSDGALACFLRDKTSGAPTVYFFSAPGLVAMDGSKWHHAALTRDQSSKLTLWLDGTAVATQTSNANPTGNSNAYDIGHFDISQERWTGHIDEVRITEGVCRYTEAFTPPTQPFPNQGQA
ncbi:LamG domain-containing protein [Marinobacter salsuginis]|uniref:LamG domain-containing protein n=1 Tax=Marinobacter salsuginis TaxID=418719 RepID=UPI001C93E35F|nr:LamG domain-containing protein [Marinobacter salsuginis]MBY6070591.1 LamG domain-containing protein [Marinobacter salsuginis]